MSTKWLYESVTWKGNDWKWLDRDGNELFRIGNDGTLYQLGIPLNLNSGAVTLNHNQLQGLTNDDHHQYLLTNGTRSMSGGLNLGSFNITNVGTVDGRDISADGVALDSLSSASYVHTFNARTGTVVPATGDYTWAQINKTVSSIADIASHSHTLLTDIGSYNHSQIDTHLNSGIVHFTEASINHSNILNRGTHTHSQIDDFMNSGVGAGVTSFNGRIDVVVPATNDYTWAQINKATSDLADLTTKSHTSLSAIGTNTHTQIDTHIGNGAIHFTESAIQHSGLQGLSADDHTQYLLTNGNRNLTNNWDAGSYQIRAETFYSDVASGTGPFTVVSPTVVTNLNADKVDDRDASYLLDRTNHINTQDLSTIEMPISGNVVEMNTALDWFRHSWSSCVNDGCSISLNGDGTFNISAGEVSLRTGTEIHDYIIVYKIDAVSNFVIPDIDVSYLYIDYNNGNPIWASSTSLSDIDGLSKVHAYTIGRDGNLLSVIDSRSQGVDFARKVNHRFLESDGFDYAGFRHATGGTVIGSTGLNLTLSAGEFYYGVNEVIHSGFDTSIAGPALTNNFTYFYKRSEPWTKITGQKTIDNTQYDLSGTLTALQNNNKFRTDWVYLIPDDASTYLAVIMGNVEYSSLTDAEGAPVPTTVPAQIDGISILVGQIVVQKNASTLTVRSSIRASFTPGIVSDHNNLTNLQGGTTSEYYHFTSSQHSQLLNSGVATGLHTHSHANLTNLTVDDHSQYALLAGRSGTNAFTGSISSTTGIYGNSVLLNSGVVSVVAPAKVVASSNDYALNITDTLNASTGSGTYTGIKYNLTKTQAAGWTNRRLIDLQHSGVSQFRVTDTGILTTAGNITASGIITATGDLWSANAVHSGTLTATGVATFSGGIASAQTFNASDGTNEGGEIQLAGAGSNNLVVIDNLSGHLRLFHTAVSTVKRVKIFGSGSGAQMELEIQGVLYGNTTSGGNLSIFSTSHATKGSILFGTSAYDEVNNRLMLGSASGALNPLSVNGSADFGATRRAYLGPSSSAALEFPRGTLLFADTAAGNHFYLMSNAYFGAGGAFLYRNTAVTAGIGIDTGAISFLTAASGTAGNAISYGTRLYVKNTGEVGVNTAAPTYQFHVVGDAFVSTNLYTSSFSNTGATAHSGLVSIASPTKTVATSNDYSLLITDTLNVSSGSGTYFGIKSVLTTTAVANYGTVYFMNFLVGGTSKFSVISTGYTRLKGLNADTTGEIGWNNTAQLFSPVNATLKLSNYASTLGATLDFSTSDNLSVRNYANTAPATLWTGNAIHSGTLIVTTSATTPIVYGSSAASGTLTFYSTSHATKGNILFGTSAYDEVNNRLGIATTAPSNPLHVYGTSGWLAAIGSDTTGYQLTISKDAIGAFNNSVASNLLLNPNGGNVGIGVNPPDSTLQITKTHSSATTVDQFKANFDGNWGLYLRQNYVGAGDIKYEWKQIYNAVTYDVMAFKAGNVGIGTTSPATSAILDVTSTTGAVLFPRMTTTQRDALTAADGMVLYNTTNTKLQVRANGSWVDGLANRQVKTVTSSSYSAVAGDIIFGDMSTLSGQILVTLPSAITNSGEIIMGKKISNDGFWLILSGSQTVDNSDKLIVDTYLNAATIISNGISWWII